MDAMVTEVGNDETAALREEFRAEMGAQIVHDSLHRRSGWTRSFLFSDNGAVAGFGSIALAGPWAGKPTVVEFYLRPDRRDGALRWFEAFVAASGATDFEVQTNTPVFPLVAAAFGHAMFTEKIVFADCVANRLDGGGALVRARSTDEEVRAAIERRQGGGEWELVAGDEVVASGGVLFHYNVPFADVHMAVAEPFRRRGHGAFFVQELKRLARELGAVPCARCNPDNVASRRTLAKTGFVAVAVILCGTLRRNGSDAAGNPKISSGQDYRRHEEAPKDTKRKQIQ